MTSRIIVNNIQSDTGVSTVTIASPVALSGGITGTGFAVGTGASISSPATNVLTVSTNNVERIRVGAAGSIGIGTDNPEVKLNVLGASSLYGVLKAGEGRIGISSLTWGTDANQTPHIFCGKSAASGPADGPIVSATTIINPSNQRIGSLVYACPVTGTTVTTNPSLKGVIECKTNTNVANAADTGAYLNFYTKPDNTTIRAQMTLNSNGVLTKPYQPFFYAKAGAARDNQTSNPTVFNNVVTNVGNHYDGTTNYRFTAPVAGVYLFTSQPGYKETSDDASWKLYKNGAAFTDFVRVLGGLNSHSSWSCAALVYLNVNEYVYIGWDGSAGGYHQNSGMSYFSGVLIG